MKKFLLISVFALLATLNYSFGQNLGYTSNKVREKSTMLIEANGSPVNVHMHFRVLPSSFNSNKITLSQIASKVPLSTYEELAAKCGKFGSRNIKGRNIIAAAAVFGVVYLYETYKQPDNRLQNCKVGQY